MEIGALVRRSLQPGSRGVGLLAKSKSQQLGAERLLGVPRRALTLAPSALGACVDVEQRLPREVTDRANTEGCVIVEFVDVLEIDGLTLDGDGLQGTECRSSIRVALEPHIEERQEAVPGNAHRRLRRDSDQPGQGYGDLDERNDRDAGFEGGLGRLREPRPDPRREGEVHRTGPRRTLGGTECVLHCSQGDDADADEKNRYLDVVGLPHSRTEEAGVSSFGVRPIGHAQRDKEHDRQHHEPGKAFDQPLERGEVAEEGNHEIGVE